MTLGTLVAVWVVCLIAGTMIGHMRGNAALGFLCPFVLGPLGLVAAFVLLKDPPDVTQS